MTFDIEVADNDHESRPVDSVRGAVSDLGGLDSRRSLSDVLNEGDLDHVKEEN